MSVILRSLMRDPLVTRPLTRALRRFDDDWFLDEWPLRKVRRTAPRYEPVSIMEEMSRQMNSAIYQMQNMVEEMETLDELANRWDEDRSRVARRSRNEAEVRRTESGNLQLALDVADFKPDDLKIKLVDDNLVVEAQSEQSGENSFRRNHFKRWFKVPEDCKLEEIRSKLTEDNKLLIELPLNKPLESNAREIPIEMAKPQEQQQQAVSGGEGQQQHQEQNHEEAQRARRARA